MREVDGVSWGLERQLGLWPGSITEDATTAMDTLTSSVGPRVTGCEARMGAQARDSAEVDVFGLRAWKMGGDHFLFRQEVERIR